MKTFWYGCLTLALLFFIACNKSEESKTPKSGETQGSNQSYIQNSGTSKDSKTSLRLNLKSGNEYYLKMFTEQKITQTIMKQKQETSQSIGVSYTYKVEKIDTDGTMNLKVIYNSFLQDVQSGGNRMTYNSTNPKDKDNPFAKIYESLINKSFQLNLTPQGNVKSISGVDALLKNIIKNMKLPDPEMIKAAEASLSEQFGDKAVKETMQNMMAIYPDNPVAPGESWSKSYLSKKVFPAKYDTKWTFKEISNGKAIILVSSKIKGLPSEKTQQGFPVPKYNISGEQSGTYEMDMASGWITKGKLFQKLSGKIEIEKSEQTPEAVSIPIAIESAITMEAVK